MSDYGFGDEPNKNEQTKVGNTSASQGAPSTSKEWRLIEKLLGSAQHEAKVTRRWNLVFRFAIVAYLFVALYMFSMPSISQQSSRSDGHVALVDMSGVISASSEASADKVVTGLRRAFEAENSKAVVIRINSPGGSPVQSSYIYQEIVRLRALHPEKKAYAVIQDMGASGGYFVASAADEIYVNASSIVGSIGVIMNGFGFSEAIKKLGIERRVLTAGNNKAMLDPFSEMKPGQQEHVQTILDDIHQDFIAAVKAGRGERLDLSADLFNGAFWSGNKAIELGLADGLGSASSLARDVIGIEEIEDYTYKPTPFEQLSKRFGVAVGEGLGAQLSGMLPSIQ